MTGSRQLIGDEGWFALKTIPDAWADAGPTEEGLFSFVGLPSLPFPPRPVVGIEILDAEEICEGGLQASPARPSRSSREVEAIRDMF